MVVRRMLVALAHYFFFFFGYKTSEKKERRASATTAVSVPPTTPREKAMAAPGLTSTVKISQSTTALQKQQIHSTTYIEPRGIVGKQLFVHQSR